MEKEHFLDLAKNYTSLTIEDARAVDELLTAYPYCQVVRCLASRGARDNKLDNAAPLLAMSAVYSTDRAVLKDIMTASVKVRRERQVSKPPVVETLISSPRVEETVAVEHTPVEIAVKPSDGLSGDALVEEIMADLTRLQDLKKVFESSFSEFRKHNPSDGKISDKPVEKPSPSVKRTSSPPAEEKRKATSPPKTKKESPASPVSDLIPEPSSEAILGEIEASRKRVFPDSQKQKEQQQIIDQFITRQPTISKGVPPTSDGQDLAEKSASLTDNMVSETLVEILLRQGKKDKAIEVLRKLIWKFPQKKAIFAAQIEDLRK